jgi:endoglucanase
MKMMKVFFYIVLLALFGSLRVPDPPSSWIRINSLGYKPASIKVAVFCSKEEETFSEFELLDSAGKLAWKGHSGKPFGAYGPFQQTYRLNFSAFKKPGKYAIKAGNAISPVFEIRAEMYKGSADFCLRYMRQQRSGFNPFLQDSCHTRDGYTMYGPMPDSTHIDVSGGWHDASDYLQYSATSANATYYLLAAFRDFPKSFGDSCQANGLPGKNGYPDILDEAKWGLDWLLKMHPREDWMFNQLGDDRDHISMRLPALDSNYGKGYERPVYFCSGEPQGLGKYQNRATGTASTASKFSTAFSWGYQVMKEYEPFYAGILKKKARTAMNFAYTKPGVCQTAPNRAPYFYEEDNWVDDMELMLSSAAFTETDSALKENYQSKGFLYARLEKQTPWLGADTARHYQWYPFINAGHYELARQVRSDLRDSMVQYYRSGIEKVMKKARGNAFYRGVPYIWCSNNLTASLAIQCYWYRKISGSSQFAELEQACFDWLFGVNPWGTSMVYGLPSWGDTPVDPHSAFTHLKNFPIDGGLVDGPVYGNIFNSLIGITLAEPDEYAEFQSILAVYHDDYGDYSTNEPTMDGTAVLIYLLAARENGL